MGASPNQSFAEAVVVFFACTSTLSIILRLWSRKLRNKGFGADDILMVPGWMCAVAMTGTTLVYIDEKQIGVDSSNLSPGKDKIKGDMYIWIDSMLYTPAMFFIRTSILLFLAKLDQAAKVRYWLWITAIWCTLTCALWFIYFPLKCIPIQKLWDPSVPGVCNDVGLVNTVGCGLWIFGDLLIAVIPTILCYNLQMPLTKKIGIIVILSLGWFVVAASALRLVYMYRLYFTDDDLTFDLTYLTCHLETNLSVITGCSPHLKPVFRHWYRGAKSFVSTRQSLQDSYEQPPSSSERRRTPLPNSSWAHRWKFDVSLPTLNSMHRSESTEGLRDESEVDPWKIQKTTHIDIKEQS